MSLETSMLELNGHVLGEPKLKGKDGANITPNGWAGRAEAIAPPQFEVPWALDLEKGGPWPEIPRRKPKAKWDSMKNAGGCSRESPMIGGKVFRMAAVTVCRPVCRPSDCQWASIPL